MTVPVLGHADLDVSVLPAFATPEISVVVPTLNEAANVEELVDRLRIALAGENWEVIFVDDDSSDGTIEAVRRLAASDPRVRGIRRIGRRGLAGASLEGMLASSAPYVAVIDGDLQHDERILPEMLGTLRTGGSDIAIGTRADDPHDRNSAMGILRARGSLLANRLARFALKIDVHDPMSGFFMLRREVVEALSPGLSVHGFKILFDLLATARGQLRVVEVPYVFRARHAGASKLDGLVVLDYLALLVAKLAGGYVPPRFLLFLAVGASGVFVNLTALDVTYEDMGVRFGTASALAVMISVVTNYLLNNELTHRDRRRRGWRLLTGLASFAAACGIGALANVAVATLAIRHGLPWWASGVAGAGVAAVWNYVSSSAVTWRSA